MKRTIGLILGLAILLGVCYTPFLAEATSGNTSTNPTIQALLDQIEALKSQILALQSKIQIMNQAKSEVKEAKEQVKSTLRLTRQLWVGLTSEEVETLQEFLATDPDIYPEGLVTGYFGPLTQRAVKRFQKIVGLEQVGRVGPKTLSRINELLEEGAGKSGKVPPGLLRAPGIRKKLGLEPVEPEEPATTTTPEQSCLDSGGTVATSSCCESTDDFPNLCVIGACGCSLENSHEVNICNCPEEQCFDGEECVDVEEEEL